MRAADLYVGADSFFLHLAYHFDVPMFAIVPSETAYFAPPGLAAAGGVLSLAQAAEQRVMLRALTRYCHQNTST
jgi:ADP-heptose:LPS heptosyltransferase